MKGELNVPARVRSHLRRNVVQKGEARDFDFGGKRLEGQFIWANSTGVTTVKLHVLDLVTTGCEVWGTAVFAPAEA